jgi:hypothetical protein
MVEHLPDHPEIKGLSPATAAATGRGRESKHFKKTVKKQITT